MLNDMSAVIVPRSDQQNSDDFLAGPRTITITGVKISPGAEQPCAIFFEGDEGKPYKCCKSMARVLVSCWGPDASKYIGRSLTLYRDPKVTWAGMAVGGIRISHMSHIERTETLMLTATKGSRKPFVVQPLMKPADKPAEQPRQDQPAVTYFNVIDQEGNPHNLENGDNWKFQISKIIAKYTKASEIKSFIARNNGAIGDVAETHPELADEVRLLLMDRQHELEAAS